MALILRTKYMCVRNCLQNVVPFSISLETVRNSGNYLGLRTDKTNPADHTSADLARFYEVPNDIGMKKLFKKGGWTRTFMKQCETFRESCIMVRKPGLEIIHYLKNTNYDRPINRYLLYGRPGSGKSMILSYVLHYAFLQGWLLVHLPWVSSWLSIPREVTMSQKKPGFVDLNTHASEWLNHFKHQNSEILKNKNLKIQNDYQWNLRESSKAGDSIMELVDYGISRGTVSSDVVCVILQEIKLLCKTGVIKCMVLIDGCNALFQPNTKVKNESRELVPTEKISALSAFRDMLLPDWHNGAAVVTADTLAVKGCGKSYLPLHLLSMTGYEFLHPFIPVHVSSYAEAEINNVLNYYRDRLWLRTDSGDDEIKFLSGCNGYEIMRICAPL